MIASRPKEMIERRVLGAIRFVDGATRAPLSRHLTVTVLTEGARIQRNLRGDAVILTAPGLDDHTTAFETPPATLPLLSVPVEIEVVDPLGVYLPRRATIRLPRDHDPTHAANADSLFQPVNVGLSPAPAAKLESTWATVRVHVERGAPGSGPAAGALLRVTWTPEGETASTVLSQTDERGEGVVALPRLPLKTVAAAGTEATLRVVFDTVAAATLKPGEVRIVDPEELARRDDAGAAGLVAVEETLHLRAGREEKRLDIVIAG